MLPSCCQYLLDGLELIVSTLDIQPLVSLCFLDFKYVKNIFASTSTLQDFCMLCSLLRNI